MIQRIEIHGDSIIIKDNIPIAEAKRIFEEELKKSQEPIVVDLKHKAEQPDYQPTDEESERFIEWLKSPNTFMDEGHLQKMYGYPQGSAWEFFLHALGIKKIPTPKERIEKNYLSYIHTYEFTDEQIVILKKIKEIFASNVASHRDLTASDIFGNPIYERLMGPYSTVDTIFDGRFNAVLNELKSTIGTH